MIHTRVVCLLTLAAFGILMTTCAREEKFKDLGLKVAGPTDVATSTDGKYFYVLNSDFDRTYNTGSILVVDENGSKVSAVEVPRMGRSMHLSGSDLIVVFDRASPTEAYEVHLYDLSKDPTNPTLARRWVSGEEDLYLDCMPISATAREGYPYFFVSCTGGELFIGELKTPRTESTLKLVRYYSTDGRTRRAMYLDANRELLFAFPTDFSFQKATDLETEDELSFDTKTGAERKGPNEIPDDLENNAYRRRSTFATRYRYQMLIYDIAKQRELDFPKVDLADQRQTTSSEEQRWIYFTLLDADGTPDTPAQITESNRKHYRTNFWSAQPDPSDSNSFFVSHRGKLSKASSFANNIVKVSIVGDPRQTDPKSTTDEVFSFKRVFGFSGELDVSNHFPTDFRVRDIAGRPTLIVNHFKDYVNFRKNPFFGISSKVLDGSLWHGELGSSSTDLSFYQVAINQRGRALSCAFYGNAVIPLEVIPGRELKLGWENINKIE